jgi:glycosyltransferase involved in cell wall biosynthesis
MALEIQRGIPEVSLNGAPRQVNYFINHALYRADMPGTSVVCCTHMEERRKVRELFLDAVDNADYCVAMSENTAKIVRDRGFRAKNVRVIHCGVPSRKTLKFGVCGIVQDSGRKGEQLVKEMVAAGYDVRAHGEGWPCPIVDTNTEEFYESLDYYVVTSLNEGGPVPVLEALAYGVPVIAPDVGWCWEYSTIRYNKGDWKDLHRVLKGLTPRLWEDWAEDHRKFFEEILEAIK